MSSKLPDARLERAERVLGTIETSRIVAAAAMMVQIPPGRLAVKDIFEFIARLDRRGLRTLRKIALDLENCGTCYGGMH